MTDIIYRLFELDTRQNRKNIFYVGHTTQGIKKRFNQHKSNAFNENSRDYSTPKYEHIRTLKDKNWWFDIEVIEEVTEDTDITVSERWYVYKHILDGHKLTNAKHGDIRSDQAYQEIANDKNIHDRKNFEAEYIRRRSEIAELDVEEKIVRQNDTLKRLQAEVQELRLERMSYDDLQTKFNELQDLYKELASTAGSLNYEVKELKDEIVDLEAKRNKLEKWIINHPEAKLLKDEIRKLRKLEEETRKEIEVLDVKKDDKEQKIKNKQIMRIAYFLRNCDLTKKEVRDHVHVITQILHARISTEWIVTTVFKEAITEPYQLSDEDTELLEEAAELVLELDDLFDEDDAA